MSRLAAGWEWSPTGRARRIRGYVERDRLDPRLQQDMEAELAADVEWYDHPTKGRVRLVDELVHPPGALPPSYHRPPADSDTPLVLTDDLDEALACLPDDDFDGWQPFHDRRTDPR